MSQQIQPQHQYQATPVLPLPHSYGSPPPPPPPPPPPQLPFLTFEALTCITPNFEMDEDGLISVPEAQIGLFDSRNLRTLDTDGSFKISLLNYTNIVHRWTIRNNEIMKTLAEPTLRKLLKLASPKQGLGALRYQQERLVRMLGQEVKINHYKDIYIGRLEEAYLSSRQFKFTVRNRNDLPREFHVEKSEVLDWTFKIRLLTEDPYVTDEEKDEKSWEMLGKAE